MVWVYGNESMLDLFIISKTYSAFSPNFIIFKLGVRKITTSAMDDYKTYIQVSVYNNTYVAYYKYLC